MRHPAVIALALFVHSFLPAGLEAAPFRTSILPILTKAGCNAGACHGAATGQGGFRLSLLGYDPVQDHENLTRELGGRRIDVTQPEASLILRKASGQVEHEGGRKLRRDSRGYDLLKAWIAAGAPYGSPDLQVARIDVEPDDTLLEGTNRTVALRTKAFLSDGTSQDVTEIALYTSNDDAIAEVSKTGLVTSVGRGLASIMVRHSGQVAAARVAVPLGESLAPTPEWTPLSFIDKHLFAELARMRVPASPMSGDAEFLRRAHLDLTGLLPRPEVARSFLSSPPSVAKRLSVINELVDSESFIDFWTMKLADLFLLNGKSEPADAYYSWLRGQVASRVPYDQLVRALLTAKGELTKVGPANFSTLANDPRDFSEHVARMFLGSQVACARCHAHPSDRWTQEDYHQFAAYFARLRHEDGLVQIAARGEVDHPKTGKPVSPKPLGGSAAIPDPAADRRAALAEWMISPDNSRFSSAFVNRVWKHLFGRGLVEPVDDMRPTNPPTHPELLEALAADFSKHRYDLRHLIREIVSSRAYQLTSATRGVNRWDDRLYSHAYAKELPAAVFADAVAQVTGVPDTFEGYPAGTRAVQLFTPATISPELDVLGRCLRKGPCDGSAGGGGGLARALHLINGSTINDKLTGGIMESLRDLPSGDVVEELYCRALTRPPRPEEYDEWKGVLDQAPERFEAAQDLLWTLLNSREFGMNH